jgi:hypothetical protein
LPRVPAFTPTARPTSAIERPSSRTIATASRRNSGGCFDGRPRALFLLLLDMDSSYTRCPSNGGMLSSDLHTKVSGECVEVERSAVWCGDGKF